MGAIAPNPANNNYSMIKVSSNSPSDVIMNYKNSLGNDRPPRTITLVGGASSITMPVSDLSPASVTLTQAETDEYFGDTIKPITYY